MAISFFQHFNADALLQEAGTISVDAITGEKNSFTWLLQSDDDNPITLTLSAEGGGSEFLSFPQSIQIEPKQIVLVPIDVMIPSDYSGSLSLSPTLVATKLGVGESTIINLQLSKTVIISVTNKQESTTIDETITPQVQTDVPAQTDQIQASVNIEQKNDVEQTDKNGGCLIATAAYGSEISPQVQLLREMRDNVVSSTSSGATFLSVFNSIYYSFSPTIADWERQNPILKEAIRIIITPMISILSIVTLAEDGSETQIIALGIIAILLNIGMYLVAPAIIIKKLMKKPDRCHISA